MSMLSFDDFVRISRLNELEAATLRQLLADDSVMAMAREISCKEFFPANGERFVPPEESPKLAQAWFAAAYLSFNSSFERYRELNIPVEIWQDSLTDLAVWLRHKFRNHRVVGLGPAGRSWQAAIYQGKVIRTGRLECNSEFHYRYEPLYDRSGRIILQKGDPVINLHIPEDGPLDMIACSSSIRRMADFFARYRPDFHWRGFLCESWLLDRQLRPMLAETSNIIKFQNLGQHYITDEPCDTVFRLFGYADPAAVQNPTSLQKSVIEFLQRGGKFIEEGMFIPRHIVEAADFDLTRLDGQFQDWSGRA